MGEGGLKRDFRDALMPHGINYQKRSSVHGSNDALGKIPVEELDSKKSLEKNTPFFLLPIFIENVCKE